MIQLYWWQLIWFFLLGFFFRGMVDAFDSMRKERKREKQYLDEHPLCVVCQKEGRFKKATQVWIETNGNWQARCEEHSKAGML